MPNLRKPGILLQVKELFFMLTRKPSAEEAQLEKDGSALQFFLKHSQAKRQQKPATDPVTCLTGMIEMPAA